MSDNYSGNPANITTLTASVISCASGSGGNVLVGTSGAHGFATYDYVAISGVTGTTEANVSPTQITVVDSSHFLLNGVPFVHAYSSGGTAHDIALTPYFQIPRDGEPGTVASILAAIKALGDRSQYLKYALRNLIGAQAFTSSGTDTVPSNATYALLFMYGGGGAGGKGATGDTSDDKWGAGGGGGGSAVPLFTIVPVTPLSSITVTVGAGGTGVDSNLSGGNDGADSTYGSLATAAGAQGANGGFGVSVASSSNGTIASGGSPVRDTKFNAGAAIASTALTTLVTIAAFLKSVPGQGGYGLTTTIAGAYYSGFTDGRRSSYGGYAPGGGGTSGSDTGSKRGGGPGGGGAAGPGGAGGAGGNGGNGSAGAGSPGAAGSSAAANTGAGGGGGGAGGAGSSGGAAGAVGNGGSGYILRVFITG